MVSSIAVANEFIRLGIKDGETFTPMQLLKLVYIAHGWMLAVYSEPLISERIEAWRYGPVIPDLYQKIKKYGGSSIANLIEGDNSKINDEQKSQIIKFVYEQYKEFDGIRLSSITHQPNTPWKQTYEPGYNKAISDDLIQHHYHDLFEKAKRVQSDNDRT